jgi:hypothetical protein
MKTDELITALAAGAGPAPKALAARRLLPVVLMGLAAAVVGALTIGLVPGELLVQPAWWMKFGYAVLLALSAGMLVAKAARPGMHTGRAWLMVGLVALVMAAIGIGQLLQAVPADRMPMWLGHSWRTCPLSILALSVPGLALVFWALRGMAPTRPVLAGLAGGLLAGAVSAAGYALSCSELAMPFVATWYTLGILLTGALGALLGPRLLRW